MKLCSMCKERKPLAAFYRQTRSRDGYAFRCKSCTCIYVGRRRAADMEQAREQCRKNRKATPVAVQRAREKERRERHSVKVNARNAVRRAVFTGKMQKPTHCSWCGKTGRIEGSHGDYTKQLDVLWLCSLCHADRDGRTSLARRLSFADTSPADTAREGPTRR